MKESVASSTLLPGIVGSSWTATGDLICKVKYCTYGLTNCPMNLMENSILTNNDGSTKY